MKTKHFRIYYVLSLLGVLAASIYPLYMGARILSDMLRFGTVYASNYPKYVIPYTPISIAVIVGVAALPLIVKYAKRWALAVGSAISCTVFFTAELLLERLVIVTETHVSTLEDWQMYMCAATYPLETWTEVGALMGEYSPAFKIHFYIISVVIILSVLNCFYGFAHMILSADKSRLRPLVLQSAASVCFLTMCLVACFTAFYRTGEITVSPLTALLMLLFFILFGITMGIYAISFTQGRKKTLSVLLPGALAGTVTLVMYLGELLLLDGNLYRFGRGFFFEPMGVVPFAPVDIAAILFSGLITALIASALAPKSRGR